MVTTEHSTPTHELAALPTDGVHDWTGTSKALLSLQTEDTYWFAAVAPSVLQFGTAVGPITSGADGQVVVVHPLALVGVDGMHAPAIGWSDSVVVVQVVPTQFVDAVAVTFAHDATGVGRS